MKNMIKLPAIVLGLLLLLTGTTQKVMAQDEDISMQSFYDELSPYGTWIQDAQYGYVWRPDVEQGEFRPYYTNGRWAMTEYGNTWVSDYDWGWAPFHYGRWVYNRYNQWVWIPDTVWGPAWVSWRSGGGYYGWAPMGPGMNINVNFSIPDLWWVFVPQRNIYYSNFPRYYSRRNITIIHNTTIINNVYTRNRHSYYTGPRADEITRYTRQAVPVYSVNRTSRPTRSNINGNRLEIYTPSRNSSRPTSGANAAPREVVRGEGYASARPDRSSSNPGNANGRPSDVSSRPSRTERTGDVQQGSVSPRDQQRSGERPQRVERGERVMEQPRQQQQRVEQQVQPRQEQPQRVERPQPQRTERAEAPRQQQPPQRVEQTRPSRGSSESRGSSGGGARESGSSSRPTRGGRG